jgi:hypothetical protein
MLLAHAMEAHAAVNINSFFMVYLLLVMANNPGTLTVATLNMKIT